MIILSNPINLYGKKVVTDLATRTGNSTVDDYSCGLGLAYKVRELWPDNDTDANLEMLFNDQVDFNADVCQPDMTEDEYDEATAAEEHDVTRRYNPAVDTTDFNRYFRRLEDIANDYLEKYVGYMVFNIRNHASGIKAYNAKHMNQPTLISDGDDSDYTELADLQLMQNDEDWPLSVKQSALQNLPYVIKRLHNMSCYTGVHMLSFIVAFLKAKERNNQLRIVGSIKTLKKNAVIEEGVYLCDKQGNITKRVQVQNKNKRASDMFDWVAGASTEYQAYYQDYLDFVHYCNVLNIELFNDDMTKYQSEFVNSLIITTVTPNKQYDKQVFEAILGNQVNTVPNTEEDVDPVENTIDTFLQICETHETLQECILHHDSIRSGDNLKLAQSLYNTYLLLSTGQATDTSKYYWDSGYLFYNGELVVIPANMLSDPNSKIIYDEMCIINELGYIIQITKKLCVDIITLACANENVLNKVAYKDPEFKYHNWVRIGT